MPYTSSGNFRVGTLADATYRVARDLSAVSEGVATTGSATTVADTVNLDQAADYWNGGGVWILRDAAEAGAAPEGEMGQVTNFGASGILTVAAVAGSSDPFSVGVAAGDRYAVTTSKYKPQQIISAVNAALLDMGTIPLTDKTSLDTAANQTELSIPLAASMDLREVWVQTRTTDSDDNRWFKVDNWHIEKTAIGSTDLLIVPFQYESVRDVKLVYMGEHPELDDPSDQIAESVNLILVVAEAVVRLLEMRDAGTGNDPNIQRQLDRWLRPGADGASKIDRIRNKYPITKPQKPSNYLVFGRRPARDRFTYPGPA